jgi:hypothetical protein
MSIIIDKDYIDLITSDDVQRELGYDLLLFSHVIPPNKYNIEHGLKLLSKISYEKNHLPGLDPHNIFGTKLKEYIKGIIEGLHK